MSSLTDHIHAESSTKTTRKQLEGLKIMHEHFYHLNLEPISHRLKL